MYKEFFENREGCSGQAVNRDEVIKDFESKSPEAAQAEIKEILDEAASVMEFMGNRFTEISNKHKSVSTIGKLGFLCGVSFAGKPVAFDAIGTSMALNDAFKVIMTGMMYHEN